MEDQKLVEHTKKLFPNLTEEEAEEATSTLRRYFEFIIRVYERLESEETQITPREAE